MVMLVMMVMVMVTSRVTPPVNLCAAPHGDDDEAGDDDDDGDDARDCPG